MGFLLRKASLKNKHLPWQCSCSGNRAFINLSSTTDLLCRLKPDVLQMRGVMDCCAGAEAAARSVSIVWRCNAGGSWALPALLGATGHWECVLYVIRLIRWNAVINQLVQLVSNQLTRDTPCISRGWERSLHVQKGWGREVVGVNGEKKDVGEYHTRRGTCVVCSTPFVDVAVCHISVYMEWCLTFYYFIMCNFFILYFKEVGEF